MARVRMRHYISGGRQVDLENHTFADWPPAGGILECGDAEAADLIRGGMADPVGGCPHCGGDTHDGRFHGRTSEDGPILCVQSDPDDGGFLPVPAATPAADAGTEPAADEETADAPRPVRTRTAPRTKAAAKP